MIAALGRRSVAFTVLMLLCCPLLLEGQQGDGEVSGLIGGLYKVTRLAGGTHSMVGVTAAVVFPGGVEIGGTGVKLLRPVDVSVGPDVLLELRTGYGGITVTKRWLLGGRIGTSLLLGLGNAEIRALPVGNQLGSDNFFVFEPEVTFALPAWKAVRGTIGVGYRFLTGVDDLPTLSVADLRGFGATLVVVIGGP